MIITKKYLRALINEVLNEQNYNDKTVDDILRWYCGGGNWTNEPLSDNVWLYDGNKEFDNDLPGANKYIIGKLQQYKNAPLKNLTVKKDFTGNYEIKFFLPNGIRVEFVSTNKPFTDEEEDSKSRWGDYSKEFEKWWEKQNKATKTKILNKTFNHGDVRYYQMASKPLGFLEMEGWGIDSIEHEARKMGLYK